MGRALRWFRGLRRRWQVAIGVGVLFAVLLAIPTEEEPAAGETPTEVAATEVTATETTSPSASPTETPTEAAGGTTAAADTAEADTAETSTPSPSPVPTDEPTTPGDQAVVASIVDGDTIDVGLDGTEQRVRLILIDTPEVYGGVECFGREASARIAELIPVGSAVTLERDVSETDSFGRLLRYVYLADGRMLNEVMVAEGYASLATYPPDVRHEARIRAAQSAAREAGRGLWSACAETATPTPAASTPAPAPAPTEAAAPTAQAANCDPSYPDVCIPPYPPDLNCGDIPHRRFRVLPPDPHGFDGNDGDGIGCES